MASYTNYTLLNSMAPGSRARCARWEMHLQGPRAGLLDATNLSAAHRATDFPKVNPRYHAREYCYYYAIEWFHDDVHFSRMAIVKQDVCTGNRTYWHRAGAFPSEPTFVPHDDDDDYDDDYDEKDEDDGVLIFTITMRSPRDATAVVVVDASTMQTVSETAAPGHAATIGYAIHGNWYGDA